MKLLFDSTVELTARVNNSDAWLATIPETIINWKNKITTL